MRAQGEKPINEWEWEQWQAELRLARQRRVRALGKNQSTHGSRSNGKPGFG